MWSSWDYQLIANLPKTVLTALIINVIVIFIIYVTANTKLLKSVKPITKGIQDLSVGEPVQIKESGLLSEISANINRTSDILQSQKYQLRKRKLQERIGLQEFLMTSELRYLWLWGMQVN